MADRKPKPTPDARLQVGLTGVDSTDRRRRRHIIMSAAARLFDQHGYTAVGIDRIGAAAGITGPGVYRHFANKQDLLAAIIEEEMQRVTSFVTGTDAGTQDPIESLRDLVARVVAAVLDDKFLIIAFHEERNFPAQPRQRMAAARRELTTRVVDAVLRVRAGAPRAEVEFAVLGVFGLLDAGARRRRRGLAGPRLHELLTQWSLEVLLSEAPAVVSTRTA